MLLFVLFGTALGLFSDGTISARDYQLKYDSTYANTLDFCTAFRTSCISTVGDLGFHHQLDCVVTQSGNSIAAYCGGIKKDANGDTGTGPTLDFTTMVCPATIGCTITTQPTQITPTYTADLIASVAPASPSSSVVSSLSSTASVATAIASSSATQSSPISIISTAVVPQITSSTATLQMLTIMSPNLSASDPINSSATAIATSLSPLPTDTIYASDSIDSILSSFETVTATQVISSMSVQSSSTPALVPASISAAANSIRFSISVIAVVAGVFVFGL